MRVIDLFAGLGGWSNPWRERGHEVFTVDWDKRFNVDLHADILTIGPEDLPWNPDVVLASPPCECFSVMTIGRNWTIDHQPKTERAKIALDLAWATRNLIEALRPSYFVVENPRAKLRKLEPMAVFERRTVTYCQYGGDYMKPTDLWGGFPPSLVLKPICKNGAPCHISASRGSVTGTQGPKRTKFRGGAIEQAARMWSQTDERKNWSAKVAMIPEELSLAVCLAAEADIAAGRKPAQRPTFEQITIDQFLQTVEPHLGPEEAYILVGQKDLGGDVGDAENGP